MMKLIKSNNPIATEDGTQTYKDVGLFFSMNNKFFTGNIIIRLKFGFKYKTNKDRMLKVDVSHKNIKGFYSKYLEILFIPIPKGK